MIDLGVGTGVLAIGAKLMGAGHVLGIDVDRDALEECKERGRGGGGRRRRRRKKREREKERLRVERADTVLMRIHHWHEGKV